MEKKVDYRSEVLKVYPNAVRSENINGYGYYIYSDIETKTKLGFSTKARYVWKYTYEKLKATTNEEK